jgi:type III pantothenate kinase
MKLLIDVGNTRLKSALWNGSRLEPLGATTHALSVDNVDLDALWTNAGEVTAIFVASVAGTSLEQRLVQSLGRQFALVPRFATSLASACGVTNAYAQPERLGIDRFLGLIALHADQPGPCVLAGCGTALTLDALAADGTHLGGLISASPALMIDALTGGTARLARRGGAGRALRCACRRAPRQRAIAGAQRRRRGAAGRSRRAAPPHRRRTGAARPGTVCRFRDLIANHAGVHC